MADFNNKRNPDPIFGGSSGSDLEYPHWISNAGQSGFPPAGFMIFQFKRRGKWSSTSSTVSTVTLFMPEQFQAPINVMWEKKDTGISDSTIGQAARVGVDKLIANSGVTEGMTQLSQKKFGSSASAEDMANFKVGRHTNPNFKVMFKGVDFRTFSFEFKFTPQSIDDCRIVDTIIKQFRKAALPDNNDSGDEYLSYPDEVVIEYYWNGQKNEWLHSFKPAIITGLNVDYTSGGRFIAMNNGFPAETKLSLQFQETDILVRGDIDKGY